MNLIKNRMKLIFADLPYETVVTNVMRHILKIIREEYNADTEVNLD